MKHLDINVFIAYLPNSRPASWLPNMLRRPSINYVVSVGGGGQKSPSLLIKKTTKREEGVRNRLFWDDIFYRRPPTRSVWRWQKVATKISLDWWTTKVASQSLQILTWPVSKDVTLCLNDLKKGENMHQSMT